MIVTMVEYRPSQKICKNVHVKSTYRLTITLNLDPRCGCIKYIAQVKYTLYMYIKDIGVAYLVIFTLV